MPLDFLISALVTLVVVVDPIGLAPTFLAVTSGLPDEARRQVALRAPVIAGTILTGTTLIGDWLLRQLGISLPAFRIAGGLLLFSIASEMVLGVRMERQSRAAGRRSRSMSATSRHSPCRHCWRAPGASTVSIPPPLALIKARAVHAAPAAGLARRSSGRAAPRFSRQMPHRPQSSCWRRRCGFLREG
jgi:hypothetical protein